MKRTITKSAALIAIAIAAAVAASSSAYAGHPCSQRQCDVKKIANNAPSNFGGIVLAGGNGGGYVERQGRGW